MPPPNAYAYGRLPAYTLLGDLDQKHAADEAPLATFGAEQALSQHDCNHELMLSTRSLKGLIGPYEPQRPANRAPRGGPLELPGGPCGAPWVGQFSIDFQRFLDIPGVPWAHRAHRTDAEHTFSKRAHKALLAPKMSL